MLNNKWILFCTVIILDRTVLAEAQYQQCRTPTIPKPKELDGVCVSRPECKVVYDIVRKDPTKIPNQIALYLVKADCGTHDGEPFICCRRQYLSSEARNKLRNQQTTTGNGKSLAQPPALRHGRISDEQTSSRTGLKTNINHPNLNLLPQKCHPLSLQLSDRISNGDDAELFEFRFIGLLQYDATHQAKPSFFCAGSLITARYVLTAAHCTSVEGSDVKSVRLGEYNIETGSDCTSSNQECADPVQDIPVEEVAVHRNYDLEKLTNDIALLRLVRAANLKVNNVAPICLPIFSGIETANINEATVIGWGSTEKSLTSSILQKAFIPILRPVTCRDKYRRLRIQLSESHLCAGGTKNTDACRGDSGGPLFTTHTDDTNTIRLIQIGIVSGGASRCGALNFPGIYTNVKYFTTWILDNMRN